MTTIYILHTKEWGIEGVFSTKELACQEKERLVGFAAYRLAEETGDDDCRLKITAGTIDENDSIIATGL